MYIDEMSLINFRNYKNERINFHEKTNLIIGSNAQGKTNLLEGLYIMSLGKSFRTNKDKEMIGFSGSSCAVKCSYIKRGIQNSIEIGISSAGKSIKIGNIAAEKTSDLLEHVYTVIFSPEDMKIIKDEPEKRRRFMDREICLIRPVYYRSLGRYKKTLAHKNALLKKENSDEEMLRTWDSILADSGSRIIWERNKFIEKLNAFSRDYHSRITEGKEELNLIYEPDIKECSDIPAINEAFKEILTKKRKEDISKGTTGAGPQKDDIKVIINGVDARHYGSQGQQRTAALSMKLALIKLIKEEKEEDAILLLDDVLSELDESRQKFLFDTLLDIQLFITSADLSGTLMKRIKKGQILTIDKGRIVKNSLT